MSPTPTERTLRDALHAAAPTETHVDRGLADLLDRLDGPGVAPAVLARRAPRTDRRVLAAAAVVAVLAVAAAVLALTRSGDHPSRLVTTPPGDTATGWYVPHGLPDDWQLESITTDLRDAENPDAPCPCRLWLWVDRAAGRSLMAIRSTGSFDTAAAVADGNQGGLEDSRATEVDLGGGITGVHLRAQSGSSVRWGADGHSWVVQGIDLKGDDLVAAARQVVATAAAPRPPDGGYELLDQTAVAGGIDSYQDVHVILRNRATKARVAYTLSPEGRADPFGFIGLLPRQVALATGLPRGLEVGEGTDLAFLARWPGADVASNSDSAFGADPGPASPADVREVLRSLRPATAEEWAAFSRTATGEVDPKVRAATLFDLAKPSDPPPATTDQTGSAASDLQLAPVLAVSADCSAFATSRPNVDGSACYQLGPVAATGADLHAAQAVDQGDDNGWVVTVRARKAAVDDLGAVFDACYRGDPTCPPPAGQERGAIAIIWKGNVISAPSVNGVGLAKDTFVITSVGGESMARAIAAAVDGG